MPVATSTIVAATASPTAYQWVGRLRVIHSSSELTAATRHSTTRIGADTSSTPWLRTVPVARASANTRTAVVVRHDWRAGRETPASCVTVGVMRSSHVGERVRDLDAG